MRLALVFANDRLAYELTLTACFKHASAATSRTSAASLASWAGRLSSGFSRAFHRKNFPFAVTLTTVTFASAVTIRANVSFHLKASTNSAILVRLRCTVKARLQPKYSRCYNGIQHQERPDIYQVRQPGWRRHGALNEQSFDARNENVPKQVSEKSAA